MTTAGNPVGALSDFELRHLTAHLEAAGRSEDLYRLLALDFTAPAAPRGRLTRLWRRGPEPRVNAWYDAKLAADGLDDFVADVLAAWRLAEEASVAAIEAGGRSATLGVELRCAGTMASLRSLGKSLPGSLLAGLVRYGIWSAQRALAHARMPGVDGRMEWAVPDSAELLHWLSEMGHREMALDAARSLPDPVDRAVAMGAAGAPPEEVVSMVGAISDPETRARAVQKFAPYLDRGTVDAAARLLTPGSIDSHVGWAVRALSQHMAQIGEGRRAVELVLQPWTLDDASNSGDASLDLVVLCRSVEEMACHLGPADVRALIARLADPTLVSARGEVLAALAPYLPGDVLDQARALAATVNGETQGRLQAALVDGDPATLRERARETAAKQDRQDRARVLTCIALRQQEALRERLLADAVDAAVRGRYSEARAEDMLTVLAEAGRQLRTERAGSVLRQCRKISDPFRRSYALERLANMLEEPRRTKVLRKALRAATASNSRTREAYLAALVGRDPVIKLLARLQPLGLDDRGRIALRAWLRPDIETLLTGGRDEIGANLRDLDHVAEVLVSQGRAEAALAALGPSGFIGGCDDGLAALIRHLPADCMDRAATVVRRIRPRWERARPQAALAARLVELSRVEEGYRLCRELVEARPAGGIEYVAVSAVEEVVPLLGAAGRLDLAEALCSSAEGAGVYLLALIKKADRAEPQQARTLLESVLARLDEEMSAGRLRSPIDVDRLGEEMAGPLLRHGLVDQALEIAERARQPVRVLARIVAHADEPERSKVFETAYQRVRGPGPGHGDRESSLTNLEFLLRVADETEHDRLLTEYLAGLEAEKADSTMDFDLNSTPLQQHLPFLGTQLTERARLRGHEVWRLALHELRGQPRSRMTDVVGSLAPLAAVLAAPEAATELSRALDDVGAWWP